MPIDLTKYGLNSKQTTMFEYLIRQTKLFYIQFTVIKAKSSKRQFTYT